MHAKDKKAFEQIDAMMMNSDGPITDYAEIEGYVLRWKKKLDETAAEANAWLAKDKAGDEELDLLEKIGSKGPPKMTRLPGDTDGPRRHEEPMDYNRAQPSEDDVAIVRDFIEREGGSSEQVKSLLNSQFSRKLGLIMAMQFNRGWDAGVEHVRDENGFSKGYDAALDVVKGRINKIEYRGNKKNGRSPKQSKSK